MNPRVCPKCGAETKKEASFCGRCGAKLPSARDAAPARSPQEPGTCEGGEAAQSSAEEKLATTDEKETRYPGLRKLRHAIGALLIGTSLVVGTWYCASFLYRQNSPGTAENRNVAKTPDVKASEIKRTYDFATPVPSISVPVDLASGYDSAMKEHDVIMRKLTPVPSPRIPVDLYVGERYPETRNRLLGDEEAARMSYAQLRYAINEVYARYGAEFPTQPEIDNRFRQFDWYRPRRGVPLTQIENEFTYTERTNVELLAKYRDLKKPR